MVGFRSTLLVFAVSILIGIGCNRDSGSMEKITEDVLFVGQNEVILEFSLVVCKEIYENSDFGEPPQLAIWLEQAGRGKMRTVWVARRSGRRIWKGKVECMMALPFWESRHKNERSDFRQRGLLKRLIDAITGATPKGGVFTASVRVPLGSRWEYYIEVNVSGDYNVTFPSQLEGGTPDPEGNGQPSLIYRGRITALPDSADTPELIGRTDQWIPIDYVIPDLHGITNARDVVTDMMVTCISDG